MVLGGRCCNFRFSRFGGISPSAFGDNCNHGLLRQINEQAIARLSRDWAGLHKTHVAVPAESQGLAVDLDLFGPCFVVSLSGRPKTTSTFRLNTV